MPYLDLTLAAAAEPDSAKLAAELTDLVVERLGKKREVTAVTIGSVPHARWFIGGRSLAADESAFHLDIKVTDGTNTKDERARFVAGAFALLERHLGRLQAASYVVVHELSADTWGYAGQTQEFRYIRSVAL